MRVFAETKGYTLSDHGLVEIGSENTANGICCQTEEEVFKALGFPYKAPKEREV